MIAQLSARAYIANYSYNGDIRRCAKCAVQQRGLWAAIASVSPAARRHSGGIRGRLRELAAPAPIVARRWRARGGATATSARRRGRRQTCGPSRRDNTSGGRRRYDNGLR